MRVPESRTLKGSLEDFDRDVKYCRNEWCLSTSQYVAVVSENRLGGLNVSEL